MFEYAYLCADVRAYIYVCVRVYNHIVTFLYTNSLRDCKQNEDCKEKKENKRTPQKRKGKTWVLDVVCKIHELGKSWETRFGIKTCQVMRNSRYDPAGISRKKSSKGSGERRKKSGVL